MESEVGVSPCLPTPLPFSVSADDKGLRDEGLATTESQSHRDTEENLVSLRFFSERCQAEAYPLLFLADSK
jgi:hypothetical protein